MCVCVCVCVRERERDRETVCVHAGETVHSERCREIFACKLMCMRVCEWTCHRHVRTPSPLSLSLFPPFPALLHPYITAHISLTVSFAHPHTHNTRTYIHALTYTNTCTHTLAHNDTRTHTHRLDPDTRQEMSVVKEYTGICVHSKGALSQVTEKKGRVLSCIHYVCVCK